MVLPALASSNQNDFRTAIQVLRDTELIRCDRLMVSGRLGNFLSAAEQGMEEIRMRHNFSVIGLLIAFNAHAPRLKRLEVFVSDHHPLQSAGWGWVPISVVEIEIRFYKTTREFLISDNRTQDNLAARLF
jgi:hypothetical protein